MREKSRSKNQFRKTKIHYRLTNEAVNLRCGFSVYTKSESESKYKTQ